MDSHQSNTYSYYEGNQKGGCVIRLILICSFGLMIGNIASAANLFYPYNGEYKVVDRDCFYLNTDGSCGDNYGSITEVKIEADSKQAQIYTATDAGHWSPYASFPLKEGTFSDAGGSVTTLNWYQVGNVVGIRITFDSANYSATSSLEPTAKGLKLAFAVGNIGNPGTEKPNGILYLAPK
jgi:hypothetical protein